MGLVFAYLAFPRWYVLSSPLLWGARLWRNWGLNDGGFPTRISFFFFLPPLEKIFAFAL